MSDFERPVSSPIGTGGSGTFFEQHVNAYFLALLLVRGIPPILMDCQVKEVHFQTEHLGWNTDDVLIIGNQGEDRCRNLVAQVKRNFTVSSNDTICIKAFVDFWKDFNNKDKFNPEIDRLALITLRGTNVLLDKFGSLLDCARASLHGLDFGRRLSIEGLLSKKARAQADAIQTIIEKASGRSISMDEFWKFLCVLHVISLDLNTQTAQNEALTKTLLASTSNEIDPVSAAEATWDELLRRVGGDDGMPAAGSYKYEDLPKALRQRHTALPSRPDGHLGQLASHSSVTLNAIHTKIAGSVEIRREVLETQVLDSLESEQITLISGAAGHGKSAVAKNVIELIKENILCLAFRSEEFASSHIDQSLQAIQSSLTAERLMNLLSAQDRKIILVESIERLLESSDRKAFMDLLRLARKDTSLRLILTCRTYSVGTVKTSLLEQVAISYRVIDVPPFTDDELDQVAQKIPEIALAIQNPNLRRLIRSPYFLNTATRICWAEDEQLPDSEQTFRHRCWSEVIRSDVNAVGGMPREREKIFVQLALRRAKELRPYVQCGDFDADVLEALHKDSLIVFSKDSLSLAAPAHDVLEDWAIIHWLNSQFAIRDRDEIAFADDIGGYPALRRGYRKWLGELLRLKSEGSDKFVLSAFQNETLPAHFRDDTIICTLMSSSAEDFLLRNRIKLLEHDGRLLIRVVHLLRVACKTTPSWLPRERGLSSQLLIPTGTAWASIVKITSNELESLLPENLGVILGLVEDWSQQVNVFDPNPDGYKDAGKIVFRLLADLNGYKLKDLRRRTLEIFAKIPNSVPEEFRKILRSARSGNSIDDVSKDLIELLLTESSCAFACRDFPQEIVDLAMGFFCLTQEDAANISRHRYHDESSLDIGRYFGLKKHLDFTFSVPASAYRGPFLFLLRSHPQVGVKFITKLINHACTWYGEQKWTYKPLEPAWQIDLIMPGENITITQWANARLYNMYRGTSVAPYVLQSALMALEYWLLNIADLENVNLESWLLYLLKESNNVAVTAVIASVCIAKPNKCGRAGLALLSSQDLFKLDRTRKVQDLSRTSMAKLLPSSIPKHKIYDEERIESDNLAHRESYLESLAIQLQLGVMREEVWKIIEEHRTNLLPVEDQSEEDYVWRLALHRMDMRGFTLGEEVPSSKVNSTLPDSEDEDGQRYFTLIPSNIEPEIQEMVDRATDQYAQHTEELSLLNWGHSAWRRKLDGDSKPWQEMLSVARAYCSNDDTCSLSELTIDGPGLVASSCIRDHWDELPLDDRSWCLDKLIEEIEKYDGSSDIPVCVGRGGMNPDRTSAYTLPRVKQDCKTSEVDNRIITAIAKSLTHSVFEVREYAAEGIGYYLGKAEPDFVIQCVGALAKQVRLMEELRELQEGQPYSPQISRGIVTQIRKDIVSDDLDIEYELNNLRPEKCSTRPLLNLILSMLGYLTESKIAFKIYEQVACTLVKDWTRDKQNRHASPKRDFNFEFGCKKQFAEFTLKLGAGDAVAIYLPIIEAIEVHPKFVTDYVEALIYAEDVSECETPFWEIWQAFADRLIHVKWIGDLDGKASIASNGSKLLSTMLLGVSWKDNIRYWSRMKDQERRIETLVRTIPATSSVTVLKAYCRFLFHVGEKVLPENFTIVAELLKTGNSYQVLTDSYIFYYLELLLRRFVYGEPQQLKANSHVRQAVLYILDQLVEVGSSAAYQMRDDFVTPASAS